MSLKLYRLIHALSKSEKRHFKLFSGRHKTGSQSNYVKLFDALAHQSQYDEKKLVQSLSGSTFINRLSSEKVYLYKLILQSLRSEGKANVLRDTLCCHLLDARNLNRKRLYKQSWKLLEGASQTACKEENFSMESLLLEEMKGIVFFSVSAETKIQVLQDLQEKIRTANEKESNLSEYRYLALKSRMFLDQFGEARCPAHQKAFAQLMTEPLLQSPELALSKKAQIVYYQTHYQYAELVGNYEAATSYIEKIRLMLEDPSFSIDSNLLYYSRIQLAWLDNYTFCENPEATDFYMNLEQFRGIPARFPKHSLTPSVMELINLSHALEANFERRHGSKAKLKNAIQQTEAVLENETFTDELAYINHVILSTAYFSLGQIEKAEVHNLWTLNKIERGLRMDLNNMAACLDLLIHYELGNKRFVHNKVNTLIRKFQRADAPYKTEQTLLKTLRLLTSGPLSKDQSRRIFENMKIDIRSCHNDPGEGVMLKYIDIEQWADRQMYISVQKQ